MSGDGFDGLDENGKVIVSNPKEDPANQDGEYMAAWGEAILDELRGIREAILTLAVLYGAHHQLAPEPPSSIGDYMKPSAAQGHTAVSAAMVEVTAYIEQFDAEIATEAADGGD